MKLHTLFGLGDFGTNCYIIETENKNAVIIDAPYSAETISLGIERSGLSLKKILLTHGHCDHIEALNGLVKKYGCEVYISEQDEKMLRSSVYCLADYFGTPFEPFGSANTLKDGDEISLDDLSIKVLHTPGHSPGSLCYIAEGCIFTGDTLFEGTVGRTDTLGGDWGILMRSLEKLYRLDRNYVIYPGHGLASDLDAELRYNPYLEHIRSRL